ncbi:MAG: DUF192 domain-containing protein [Thermoleophilaceae bacterium]
MHRRRAPKDGMLFVFPSPTKGGFWMKNTLVPLTIVFFDSAGAPVRRLSMTPCRRDPCPIYEPRRTYRFALELRATDRRPRTGSGRCARFGSSPGSRPDGAPAARRVRNRGLRTFARLLADVVGCANPSVMLLGRIRGSVRRVGRVPVLNG